MHSPSSPKHLTKQNVDVQRLGRTEAGEGGRRLTILQAQNCKFQDKGCLHRLPNRSLHTDKGINSMLYILSIYTSLLLFSWVCLCMSACVRTQVDTGAHVCHVCWRPVVSIGNHSPSFFHLIHGDRVCQSNPQFSDVASLALLGNAVSAF